MNFSEFAERNRIRIGVLIVILILAVSKPSKISILAGFIISTLGSILRIWSSGYIRKEKELTASGPYRFTRNPLYLGNFLIGIGFCIATWQIISLILFAIYFTTFYISVIKREEKRLFALFGDSYIEYKNRVPSFFPKFTKIEGKGGFSFRKSIENKEWRAILSTLLFYIFLILKEIIEK
ncbi:MAG: methyltransferase family protein [Candidatus Aminicenantia bacterium]